MILGVATHMAYCVAGLAVLITTTPWLFNALKYTGAVYLIWIGIQALRSRGGGTLDLAVGGVQRVGHWSAFLQGYLCNLLNPKATLFFLAVFTQVLSLDSSFAEKLWYAGIIVGLAALWWPLLVVLIQSAVVRRGLARAQGGGQAARRPADRPRGQGRPELRQAGGATPRCGAGACLRARR